MYLIVLLRCHVYIIIDKRMMLEMLCGLLIIFTAFKVYRRRKCSPDFTGKNVWITGASSGIGEALAYEFNILGANIILSARNIQELKRVKRNCPNPEKVQIISLDMTKYDEIEQVTRNVVEDLEGKGMGLDIVVENAGISMRCDFKDYNFNNHLAMFDVNVNGPYRHIQCFLQHMINSKKGHIVGVTSAAGKLAKGYRSSYAGSKHAMIGILDSLRSQLYEHNIKVSNIMPGYVQTNLSKNALGAADGQKYGQNDENNKKGMKPDELARTAIRAIYQQQKQLQISNTLDVPIGIFLRNTFPDLFFFLMRLNARKQSRISHRR